MFVTRLTRLFSLTILIVFFTSCANKKDLEAIEKVISKSFNMSEQHYKNAVTLNTDSTSIPNTSNPDGSLKTVDPSWWTSGFFTGNLWLLYEYTGKDEWKKEAQKWMAALESQKYNTNMHDLGFMINCSFGNALRLTGDTALKEVIITAAKSLSTRFRENVGCIQSWDKRENWDCPVIIDNMMNLELLFLATQLSGDSSFYKIAVTHANTTMKNHFRDDYSSYHVLDYDTVTGEVIRKGTVQGLADSSTWARGQAWGLYSYTMCYRITKDEKYLDQANSIAQFLLNHKNLPEDLIPFWDFDAPNEERDASAGAIICSGLLELSQYVNKNLKNTYIRMAGKMIESLSSPQYFAKIGENNNFALMHSVGHKPGGWELDAPFNFADYYYFEAMIRYKNLVKKL